MEKAMEAEAAGRRGRQGAVSGCREGSYRETQEQEPNVPFQRSSVANLPVSLANV